MWTKRLLVGMPNHLPTDLNRSSLSDTRQSLGVHLGNSGLRASVLKDTILKTNKRSNHRWRRDPVEITPAVESPHLQARLEA
jgi:hypothetical protein